MQLEQRRLWAGSTQLALRQHGFYICQRQASGRAVLEVELPYEEILPVRVERRNTVPHKKLLSLLAIACWWLFTYSLDHHEDATFVVDFWLWFLGLGGSLGAYIWYGWQYQWREFALLTARSSVILADRTTERDTLHGFAESLERRTKSYLRREYGQINPLGPIEMQLSRLNWLHTLEVLTDAETRASTTRLTGRLSTENLRSMGQDLEMPYVN
ncbi:hypothetical protein KBK19_09860 [Microvirga sp. STR05]|uniref:Uncharacterized protein n=1 Tax=Hymenobacter duratus TaxID=2771356 RepID=A0ABR8JHN2_9BACT|nr:hypothetical protein [Hymenobacter duratus]MBD2715340.1 hypothetical protein [Hymenobacter duratus]MBR7950247.1 hypothetical protein [Microvirga sp. STR05]